MTVAREIRLRNRPIGLPSANDFELATADLRDPGAGEVQVRNLWMSVDPYMRPRMNAAKGYAAPFQIGRALDGGAIGEVVASNVEALRPGDLVQSGLGWREAFTAPAEAVQALDLRGLPPQAFLGAAGMTGLTAYAGLLKVAALRDGDVVFVSGAAGAVGSMVCQIAKAKGHRVIGSAGGSHKAAYLTSLGVDAVIDHTAAPSLGAALAAAAPEGIDIYFDNVGGPHLEAALEAARPFARIAVCGMISLYNATRPQPGPSNLGLLIGKSLRMEGFLVSQHADLRPQFLDDLSGWIARGQVQSHETVFHGLESAPDAFLGLFSGRNLGKMLVKLR